MKLSKIKYADTYLTENSVTKGGDKYKKIDIIFQIFLLEFDNKKVLVDAGCDTMPHFEMKNFVGSVTALENMGVSPDEITDVIITHSHHDHAQNIKYFKNATVYIQKDEYIDAKRFIPSGFKVRLFEDEITLYDKIKVVKIGLHSIGSCVVEFDNTVILGDECYSRRYFKINAEKATSEKEKNFFKKYENYTLLFSHDI